jgi:protein TonB
VRRAVLAHELLHVERRDWAWVLVEEMVRTIFWFHPGVWWLISNVQLAREEVVDELAVLVTGQRRAYVEALLAFADETPLAPAPAFARRRHLFHRMMLISKEAVMSPRQIVVSCAVMALMVGGGGWYAVRAFPLVDAAQHEMIFSPRPQGDRGPLERSAVRITPENPIPRRVNVVNAEYPQEARAQNATGVVTVQVTLDAVGRVAESRATRLHVRGAGWEIGMDTVTSEGLEKLLANVNVAEARPVVDAFIHSAVAAVQQWRYDPPFQAPISFPVTISFSLGATESTPGIPPPPPPPPPPGSEAQVDQSAGWTADGALRVGGGIKPPKKIRDVRPAYPPVARDAGVQGVVIIEARIGPDGHVTDARVLKSIPLLDEAALDAVKQWEFTPTLVNGEPTAVVMTTTVNFTLQ